MNTQEAILAHARWKTLLATYLSCPNGSINANNLQADDKCDLGHWIHHEGKAFAALPEYTALLSSHAKFHRAAADIVRKADTGRAVNADAELGMSSPFGVASLAVVSAIKTLFAKSESATPRSN